MILQCADLITPLSRYHVSEAAIIFINGSPLNEAAVCHTVLSRCTELFCNQLWNAYRLFFCNRCVCVRIQSRRSDSLEFGWDWGFSRSHSWASFLAEKFSHWSENSIVHEHQATHHDAICECSKWYVVDFSCLQSCTFHVLKTEMMRTNVKEL